jgi:hypothetical protein
MNSGYKESQKYLGFLRRNIAFITIPGALSLAIGVLYIQSIPPSFKAGQYIKVRFEESEIQDKIKLADQIVTDLRVGNLQNSLNVDQSARVSVYKNAPLSFMVEAEHPEKLKATQTVNVLTDYVVSKYPVEVPGNVVERSIPPEYLKLLIGSLAAGAFIGLVISLAREYFKNF